MSLLDDNTQAVSRESETKVATFIAHFSHGKVWDEFTADEAALEELKMHLTNLANMVEHRIQEIHPTQPQDFGT